MARRKGSGEWERPYWQQRGWVISAGFLLVMTVLATIVVMSDDGAGGSDTGGDKPSASPTTDPDEKGGGKGDPDDARPAGCRTDDSDQETPEEPPSDLKWKANGPGVVPVSKSAGPTKYDGPIWSCFARTPMGAVMAVHAITDQMPYDGWERVVEEQMVAGPGRDALIAERKKEKNAPKSGSPSDGGYAGFQVLSYSKNQVAVMVLLNVKGRYASTSVSMKWQDGDWKLVPQPDGSMTSSFAKVSDTDGFVTWGQ